MWSKNDEKALKKGLEIGKNIEEIAELINKSPAAVRQKLRRGIEKDKRFWTRKEEIYVKDWYGKKDINDLAEILNRSKDAIRSKYKRMKNKI